MASMAYNVGLANSIFTTPFTFVATTEVALLGAAPIFVDIDPKKFNIDHVQLKNIIEDYMHGRKQSPKISNALKSKGIIVLDLFGLLADHDSINEIAEENDLIVIEDAA